MSLIIGNAPGVWLSGGGRQETVYDSDWFVDSVNGDDGNDGTAPNTAFATLGALPEITAGMRIALANGSHWDEQLTIAVDNVIIEAYGSGARPILDCSTVYANASFSKTGGRTYVYQVNITTNYVSGEPSFVGVWEDDTRLVNVASLALCDSTAGSYYVASHAATSITLYVHAADNSDITANGKVYEIADRGFGIYATNANSLTLRGLHCRRNYSNAGSIKAGRYARIYDCVVEDGNSHNIYVKDGSLCDGVHATGIYYTGSMSMFVYNENVAIGAGVTFRNCIADNKGVYSIAEGFYGHINTSGSFGAVLFDGCQAEDLAIAYDGVSWDTFIMRDCTASNCRSFMRQNGGDTLTRRVENGTFSDSVANASPIEIASSAGGTLEIVGLEFSGDITPQTAVIYCAQPVILDIQDVVFGGTYTKQLIQLAHASAQLSVSGCDFVTDRTPYYWATAPAAFTSNNNHFSYEATVFYVAGATYNTVTLYRAGTGQDANSTVG